MPGDSGVLVVTRVRSTTPSAHEAAGAAGTRRSQRPLFWAKIKCISSGASRREREGVSANNAAVEVGFRTKHSPPSFLQTRSSCPDLIRASIPLRNNFLRRGWITGSSPVINWYDGSTTNCFWLFEIRIENLRQRRRAPSPTRGEVTPSQHSPVRPGRDGGAHESSVRKSLQ